MQSIFNEEKGTDIKQFLWSQNSVQKELVTEMIYRYKYIRLYAKSENIL